MNEHRNDRTKASGKRLNWDRAWILILAVVSVSMGAARGQGILDKQSILDKQTYFDNRDWDWYKANIPFVETPDADIDMTDYYRWELITKHMVYGSPEP